MRTPGRAGWGTGGPRGALPGGLRRGPAEPAPNARPCLITRSLLKPVLRGAENPSDSQTDPRARREMAPCDRLLDVRVAAAPGRAAASHPSDIGAAGVARRVPARG